MARLERMTLLRKPLPPLPGLLAAMALVMGLLLGSVQAVRAAQDAEVVEARLAESARYLASDELEGRGIGTKGLDLAADFVAAQFAQIGLKTDLYSGKPFQAFAAMTGSKLGPDNRMTLTGPPDKEGEKPVSLDLQLGRDFNPMSLSGSGTLNLPLVFVGYGITGEREKYDDYGGIDVKGKAVIILRHEPQQDDEKSVFAGKQHSQHAPFARKAANAVQHGAAAVIFCSDQFDLEKNAGAARKAWYEAKEQLTAEEARFKEMQAPALEEVEAHRKRVETLTRQIQALAEKVQPDYDPLVPFETGAGATAARNVPVVYCRRAVVGQVVRAALGKDLAEIEKEIDQGPTPQSRALEGWSVRGQVDVRREEIEIKNVLGVLEAEGPLAEQTIVVGAHYDHLGYGGAGSLDPTSRVVHNGADDNASGVAAMIEIARALAARQPRPKRRVVFIAFTGEERGLLGSSHYARQPLVPLDKTVAMLNLDMVGRLRDDRLTVMGTGTAKQFGPLLDQLNAAHGFQLAKVPSGFGPSDHSAFYAREVPVLHFFTGTHKDYHRPSDDFETLNIPGMRRIAAFATEIAAALADAPDAPEYVAVAPGRMRIGGDRPYLGTMPDFGRDAAGYAVSGVVKGGPAERAGLQPGDVIVQFGDAKIGGLEDMVGALSKHKAGDRVRALVRRGSEETAFEVTLDPPR